MCDTAIYTQHKNPSNLPSFKIVHRGSETQLRVTENITLYIWQFSHVKFSDFEAFHEV